MSLVLQNLSKFYINPDGDRIHILKNVDLTVEKAQTIAILGKSGSGKSTLLNLIAGLDRPSGGEVRVHDNELSKLSEKKLSQLRAQHIGFVFQQFHLIPTLTVEENVLLPLEILSSHGIEVLKASNYRKRVEEVLAMVGLGKRMNFFPEQISGGEMQRVAIARALIHEPRLVLADEPNANLDQETGQQVMDFFFAAIKQTQTSLVLVTHDSNLAQHCDQRYQLSQGALRPC